MLNRLLLPIINTLLPGLHLAAVRTAILQSASRIDSYFFNNSRAVRVFGLWCLPGLLLFLVSIFVPDTAVLCPGALWLLPIGLIFAFIASRGEQST